MKEVDVVETKQADKILDPRVRRTRRWLREALAVLLQEKSYSDISITDITKTADLARITFYQHFESKDALLLSAVEDFFESIFEAFDITRFWEFVAEGTLEAATKVDTRPKTATPTQLLLMQVALKEIGSSVRELMVESFLRVSREEPIGDEQHQRLLASYHVGGTLALLEQFLAGDIQTLPKNFRIIPIIFLRSLVIERAQNGLLEEALSPR